MALVKTKKNSELHLLTQNKDKRKKKFNELYFHQNNDNRKI